MNPGGGGCGEPRLYHCTPAWVTKAKLLLKKKEKGEEREREREKRREKKTSPVVVTCKGKEGFDIGTEYKSGI